MNENLKTIDSVRESSNLNNVVGVDAHIDLNKQKYINKPMSNVVGAGLDQPDKKWIGLDRPIQGIKQNTAITLIALIITIIILLILAGITLNMIMGDNGIFEKASMANQETNKGQALEELRLLVLEVQSEKNGKATLRDVLNKLNEDNQNEYIVSLSEIAKINGNIPNVEDAEQIYVVYKNYQFKIDSNLYITFLGDKREDNSEIEPAGINKDIITLTGKCTNRGEILISVNSKKNYKYSKYNYYISDNEGETYTCYKSSNKTFTFTNLKDDCNYVFYIEILDSNNNITVKTSTLEVSTEGELVLITYPENGAMLANDECTNYSQYAKNAFDNNLSTTWCNNDRGGCVGWIQYDFGSKTSINAFSFTSRTDGFANQVPKDFSILGSDDGEDYTIIQSYSESYTTSGGLEKIYYLKDSASYRYYKFDITSSQGGANLGISEIKFYIKDYANVGIPEKSIQYNCYDFTKMSEIEYPDDGEVSFSAQTNSEKGIYAFDGDYTTKWCNSDASGCVGWIQYDFGKENETEIEGFTIQARSDGFENQVPKDFILYASNDGENYVIINEYSESYESSKGNIKQYYASSNDQKYRYYKFDITSSQGGNNIGIAEIKFYK